MLNYEYVKKMTILINFYKDVKACVQPNENYQCPEGLTLRHNLCYPSQPGTEEETYVPSPRKTPSMSEHTIPLVTAAVGIPLLLIFLRDAAGVNLLCPPWGTEPAYFSVICSYTY
ncbi:uncharacterized protein LOC143243090 isoform X1 [Tachypleus tridentatus]|uniref:uncharacterized protein LOC143243090 isoform X1 n=1 Tax=Tachypleus tridentatus TaxID=6853 RepID=UPI003FD0F6C1